MARLEIEIAAVNSELKRVLSESKTELKNFVKGLDFKPTGINNINTALSRTKQLLQDIATLSAKARGSLSGNQNVRLTQQERDALVQAQKAAQDYRTEQARLSAQLAATRLQTAQNRTATVAASGSYKEAQQTLTALGRSIREAAGGFNSTNPAVRAQITQYRELNARLREFDATMGNHQRNVGNYASALRGLQGLAASYFGFTSLLAAGRQVLRSNAEISDSLADVRRTAGLTAKEADNLTESLKKIDTRTDLKGLLSIAVIAGQLGIAKNQIAGFTEAVDQLAVTLGGELKGGAEGIAKSLGVLDNVFGITKANAGDVNKAYNQIGSAILVLGQSGLATGDFLADFGERVGGVAKQAGLALPVVLAYGAVLQENGVSAEVAGTAFKRLISAMAVKSEAFLGVAKFADVNLTLKDFNTLVNTDTKKALDLFFEGLNKGGKSTIAFNSILKSLKISGAGVSQVVAAISNNLPTLNERIAQGTKGFEDATASGEQFLIKNDNLAGSIDKLGKTFENITNSGAISRFFKAIIDGATFSLQSVSDLFDAIIRTQAEADKNMVRASRSMYGGYLNRVLRTKSDDDNLKAAEERIRQANRASLADEAKGRGISTGKMIAAETSTQIELTKKLANERKRLTDDTNRLNYSEAFIRDPKNVGDAYDAQVAKINKLRVAYVQQTYVVGELQRQLEKLYPKNTARSNDAAPDGVGKVKDVRDITDVMKELNDAIKIVDITLGATFAEKNTDKLKAYQNAINGLIKLGYDPASKAVQNLRIEQEKYLALTQKAVASPSIAKSLLPGVASRVDEKGKPIFDKTGQANLGITASPITPDILTQTDLAYAQLLEKQAAFNESFKQLAESGISETLGNIGTSIAEALAEGGSALEAVGGALLEGFSQFLDDYGDLLIKYGAAAVIKGKLDAAALIPGAGIAAGLAAIAAGVALKTAAAAINSRASGSNADQSGRQPSKFANGGIVSGPTLGIMGEYPGAKNNPEVISPLDKLNSLISRNIQNTLAMGLGTGSGYTGAVKRIGSVGGGSKVTGRTSETIILGLDAKLEGSTIRLAVKRADEIAKRGG